MVQFFDTAPGQMIAGAKKYLSAADILMQSEDFAERPSLLLAPILHLAAHGAELLLKYPLVSTSKTQAQVRREFGHDLLALWNEPANSIVRSLILLEAEHAWSAAKADPRWQDKFEGHPHHTFEAALKTLARLHSAESNYALRYIVEPNTLATAVVTSSSSTGHSGPRCEDAYVPLSIEADPHCPRH